ncbi:MAG: carbon storage regulator [Chromatiaceae bacterium]|nr:carbon storage regulator [Gammaproteobacteria bacterium]MCP5316977.1 carbon storage regulator [Chromatiaceae bacterium]MCW5584682.1 carbon storage regulator [Chromatiales bacterium]MCP5428765.1 carbon storage regulator [Chromatiaceae bacterium]MCP5434506.1 carbon storage regulator [Chromatiaceae bacterium]
MLLLAQHERETIILETSDGPIEVRLSRLDGTQARIGIEAPKSVRIIRKSLHDQDGAADLPFRQDGDDDPWWLHPEEESAVASPVDDVAEMRVIDWDDGTLD